MDKDVRASWQPTFLQACRAWHYRTNPTELKGKKNPLILVGEDKDSFKRFYESMEKGFLEPLFSKLPKGRKATKAEVDAAFNYALKQLIKQNQSNWKSVKASWLK